MIRKKDANKIVNILWYFFTLMYFYEISIVGALRFNLLSVFIFENKKNYEKYALTKSLFIIIFVEFNCYIFLNEKYKSLEDIYNIILYSHYYNANHF